MPEPTINELLLWLDWLLEPDDVPLEADVMVPAIRAILEHHEKLCATAERIKLEAVRAFVGRVLTRTDASQSRTGIIWNEVFVKTAIEELAAMEEDNVL